MCGIVGVRAEAWPGPDGWRRAVGAVAWRGPDGIGEVRAGPWHLACARLAVTDRATAQPLSCPRTGRTVVFNGAVTNAGDEWQRFGGARTRGYNDAELFLLRLEEGGAAALGSSAGHGAAVVVDPATDSLWLWRDPFGEKPLFVAMAGGRVVAFASTVQALRELGFKIPLGRERTAQLLRYGFCPGPDTVLADLRGVFEDLPGSGLRAVAPKERSDPSPCTLRERIEVAVARCAETEVPVALSLSGGVDSAVIAGCLARAGRSTPCYQFRATGAGVDERERARSVAAQAGLTLREVDGGPELLAALPELTAKVGWPLGDPSLLAVHFLCRAMARDGVVVVLSGEGADELFGGYDRHRAMRWMPPRPVPLWRRRSWRMDRPARLRRALASKDPYAELLSVTAPAFRAAITPSGDAGLPAGGGRDRIGWIDRELYLRWDLLPKLDTAAMAAGLEGRCPFLDPLVSSAPEARRSRGKRILRRVFGDLLPRAVRRGPKLGFALPLDAWFRNHNPLLDVLRDRTTLERGAWDGAGLARAVDRHRRGTVSCGHGLYLVAALELYLRQEESVPCG